MYIELPQIIQNGYGDGHYYVSISVSPFVGSYIVCGCISVVNLYTVHSGISSFVVEQIHYNVACIVLLCVLYISFMWPFLV